jgi:hypothetical protein
MSDNYSVVWTEQELPELRSPERPEIMSDQEQRETESHVRSGVIRDEES